jgi:hypothetical protein
MTSATNTTVANRLAASIGASYLITSLCRTFAAVILLGHEKCRLSDSAPP